MGVTPNIDLLSMNNLAQRLSNSIQQSLVILQNVNSNRIVNRDNRWNEKEIIGHLIDSAINNYSRFMRGYHSDQLVFSGYNQELWVNQQNYKQLEWSDIILIWEKINMLIVRLISSFKMDILSEKIEKHNFDKIAFEKVSKDEPTTLEYLISDYIIHLEHHIHQIQDLNSD